MPMTEVEKIQRRNRFYFYMLLLLACIGISFWSGYRLGKDVGKFERLELIQSKSALTQKDRFLQN
jgi:hypothetical protein